MTPWKLLCLSGMWQFSFLVLLPLTICFRRSAHAVLACLVLVTAVFIGCSLRSFSSAVRSSPSRMLQALSSSMLYKRAKAHLVLSMVTFGIWMICSLCWAQNLVVGAFVLGKILCVSGGIILLVQASRFLAHLLPSSFWLFVVLTDIALLFFEILEGNMLRRMVRFNEEVLIHESILGAEYINSGIVLSLLFWPALGEQFSQKKYGLCGVLTFLTILTLMHVDSDAARVGLAVGVGVLIMSRMIGHKMMTYLFPSLIMLSVILAPLAGSLLSLPKIAHRLEHLVSSQKARLIIWEYTCQMIRKKPLRGWGLGSAAPAAKIFAMPDMHGALPSLEPAPISWSAERQPLDPHNGFLHIWVELGSVGALLWGIVIAGIPLLWARRFSSQLIPIFNGFYTSALFILGVNCSVWHTWILSAIGLTGLAMVCVGRRYS